MWKSTDPVFVVTNDKLTDITQTYNNETTIIIDLCHTQTDKKDHIYSLVESFKNGRIFRPKYETFKSSHVIMLTRFIRHHDKLS